MFVETGAEYSYLSTATNGEISSSFALLRSRCLTSSYLMTDMERLMYCNWFIAMRISPLTRSASSSRAIYITDSKLGRWVLIIVEKRGNHHIAHHLK